MESQDQKAHTKWEEWHQGNNQIAYIKSPAMRDLVPSIVQYLSQRDLQVLASTEKSYIGSKFIFNYKEVIASNFTR